MIFPIVTANVTMSEKLSNRLCATESRGTGSGKDPFQILNKVSRNRKNIVRNNHAHRYNINPPFRAVNYGQFSH